MLSDFPHKNSMRPVQNQAPVFLHRNSVTGLNPNIYVKKKPLPINIDETIIKKPSPLEDKDNFQAVLEDAKLEPPKSDKLPEKPAFKNSSFKRMLFKDLEGISNPLVRRSISRGLGHRYLMAIASVLVGLRNSKTSLTDSNSALYAMLRSSTGWELGYQSVNRLNDYLGGHLFPQLSDQYEKKGGKYYNDVGSMGHLASKVTDRLVTHCTNILGATAVYTGYQTIFDALTGQNGSKTFSQNWYDKMFKGGAFGRGEYLAELRFVSANAMANNIVKGVGISKSWPAVIGVGALGSGIYTLGKEFNAGKNLSDLNRQSLNDYLLGTLGRIGIFANVFRIPLPLIGDAFKKPKDSNSQADKASLEKPHFESASTTGTISKEDELRHSKIRLNDQIAKMIVFPLITYGLFSALSKKP